MPVVEGVRRVGGAHFAVSDSGVLVYIPGPARAGEDDVFLYDRKGVVTPLPLARGSYQNPRASRDGTWRPSKPTTGSRRRYPSTNWREELDPAPDVRGQQPRAGVVRRRQARGVQSDREGDRAIFWQPIEGGAAERPTRPEPGTFHIPESWSSLRRRDALQRHERRRDDAVDPLRFATGRPRASATRPPSI